MDRFSKFAAFVRGRGWRSVLVLAFLVCAGWTPLLRAQSPVPVAGQTVSGMLPDDPSITALPAGSVTPNSPQGSRPIFDPFKPRPKFGIAAGSGTGSLGLNGAAGGFGLSVPRPSSLGRFGTTPGMGGRQGSLVTFFPTDGFATAPAIGAYGTFGPAPGTLPTLNQLMRTNLHVPLGSSSANFRLSYQDRFGTGVPLRPISATCWLRACLPVPIWGMACSSPQGLARAAIWRGLRRLLSETARGRQSILHQAWLSSCRSSMAC